MKTIPSYSLLLVTLLFLGCAHDATETRQENEQNATRADVPDERPNGVLAETIPSREISRDAPGQREQSTILQAPAAENKTLNAMKVKRPRHSPGIAHPETFHIAPYPEPPNDHLSIYYHEPEDRENYQQRPENNIKLVAEMPVSTFSIDVDSGSYTNTRRFLTSGAMPHPDSIRPEEFINYFNYQYPVPDNRDKPFTIHTEIAPSPWAEGKHLLHIGLRGFEIPAAQLPAANLVFLVDVSGSMNQPNKLPLLKTSLNLLSRQLSSDDRVSIVVYAGAAGVVLKPTPGNELHTISAALDRLQAGGSTNGGAGIQLAYTMAQQSYIKGGINRVILATDGDFNVGVANIDDLKRLIEDKRKSGIALTTLGFGMGNYNDALMNQLAEIGNGNAAYIDTALEARKVLVDEISSTLLTIAKDVKIQIEFAPRVQEYRLIGYESRILKREDFNNDRKDAGEIGAGHTVTALYEITLSGSNATSIDPLRYQAITDDLRRQPAKLSDELAFLKLRYKLPTEDRSRLIQQPLYMKQIKNRINQASNDFRFSAAVSAFAQLLRGGNYIGDYRYHEALELARGALGKDTYGYRNELINLIKMADTLNIARQPTSEPGIRAIR